ncbi:LacI family DNA-binding transcriptional regulator [Demequina capsici]|uniref:LacI family DNA-binding transcriptional regulator n=1 Tax=Demequina capsici TaxID=3075620 RepID=A0AA96F7G3_9MICO|nr:LacI family DNA-binding transcriptional regulator [Demequina sp. OYTSA14]WNM24999.1 LacI family DNA-binding transcriptional regulator [Demequina sp. OYTSA14]
MTASRPRRPTSADVARAAGVSRATVSFVLNDTPSQTISPATREAVLRAAEELGYMPSPHAAALRSGRSRLVLTLVPHWASSPTVMRYLELTGSHLAEHGLLTATHIERSAPLRDLLTAVHPAAVISLVPLEPDESDLLARAGIAEVHGYIADFPDKTPSVTLNQQHMGRAQAGHLLDRGFDRLVYVSGPRIGHPVRPAGRLEGARAEAAERGSLPVVAFSYTDTASLDAAIATWLGLPGRVGVCAFDDDTALEVLARLREHGTDIPGRVGVVGMDDIRAGEFSEPALTTIRPDLGPQARAVAHATLSALGISVDDESPVGSTTAQVAAVVQRATT